MYICKRKTYPYMFNLLTFNEYGNYDEELQELE